MIWDYGEKTRKRTLGDRDRQILWERANKRCENPTCKKKIEYTEMQAGHKIAHSRGGSITMKTAVCLCYKCNKLQGTDSWAVFLKKQGIEDPKTKEKVSLKQSLAALTIKQLKLLASEHKVTVKGSIEEDWGGSHRLAPTNKQYITKLSGIVTSKDLSYLPKEAPKPVKKRGN